MAEQLKQGSKLLWYRIESMLGRGGFGITYLATDTNLQTRVAIKEYLPADIAERKQDSYVLPRTGADGETYRWGLTRFIDEARMLARFKHHNIVRVHSVFEENNTAYMVMDYEQGNGFDLLMRTPQFREESKLKALFADLLEGLEVVHSHDVIHRDIKPANIYIREDGSPVLLDFGSARQQIAGKSHSMTRVLTKGYAPYEQMDDDGLKQGPWTDIYALGATLYYVVGSQLPVDAFSRFTKLVQKQADPLRPVHELPDAANYSREFLDAIAAAMQFEPRDRPQTVAEFRRLLLGEKPRTQPVLQPRNPPREDDATVLITPSSASLASSELTPPADPTGLSAMAVSTDTIALAWTDNAVNEDGYTIERSTDGVNFAAVASTGANNSSFNDTGLSSGTTYHYRVFAFNTAGNSGNSNTASATTMIPIPPSHCRIPRHKSSPLGMSSRPDRTVDPVVVRPDMASKNASVKLDCVSPSIKGSAPKTGNIAQTPVVSKNVCCSDSACVLPF